MFFQVILTHILSVNEHLIGINGSRMLTIVSRTLIKNN